MVLEEEFWRCVAVELPNQHGVLETEYIVEMTDPKSVDRLGVRQWREIRDSSAHSDHIRLWRYLLDRVLADAGEEPNAKHRQRVS